MTRENGLPWKWIVWDFAAWSFSDRSPGLEQREMIEAAWFVCTVPTHTALLHKPQRDPTMRNLSLSWVIGSFMTQTFFKSLQKNNFRLSSVYFMVGDGWEGEIVEAGKLSAFSTWFAHPAVVHEAIQQLYSSFSLQNLQLCSCLQSYTALSISLPKVEQL